jgi:hypothetical protein
MADRPSLEVEIPPTRSILYRSSSKELLHTALAGTFSQPAFIGGLFVLARATELLASAHGQ